MGDGGGNRKKKKEEERGMEMQTENERSRRGKSPRGEKGGGECGRAIGTDRMTYRRRQRKDFPTSGTVHIIVHVGRLCIGNAGDVDRARRKGVQGRARAGTCLLVLNQKAGLGQRSIRHVLCQYLGRRVNNKWGRVGWRGMEGRCVEGNL